MTGEATDSSCPPDVGNGASRTRNPSLAEREREISQREDLREANQHLVMATLAAADLELITQGQKRRQDEFLAMLAHELRNFLAPIRSAVALMERMHSLDPRLATIRDVIRRQVEHMARLLDDLLDASRVTSGKVTLQRSTVKVGDFVDQAVEMYRALIDLQQQHLTLNMPVTPLYVDGDLTRLAQIIGNLLHNAAKYTPEGGDIALSVRREQETVVIRVSDNGNGMSAEMLPHIFDLFTQEERSLSCSQGGLGIGLTVVRSMVERHGGTVTAQSEGLGRGSEFTVVLPRVEKADEPALEPSVTPPFVSARILLVDDNVDASKMLSMLLEMTGYEVEVTFDGASALVAFDRGQPQIIVCDIGLPDMNGYEVAKQMRLRETAGHPHALLVALTGYEGPEDRKRSMSAGFDHHVAKPVDFKDLLKLLQGTILPRRYESPRIS